LAASRRRQWRAFAHLHQRVGASARKARLAIISAAACRPLRIGTPALASIASVPTKRAAL